MELQRAQDHRPGEDFEMDDLKGATVTSCSYLQKPLNHVYVYHSYTGTRAVFAVYVRHTATCRVVVVDPGSNRDAVPNASKLWKECVHVAVQDLKRQREGWSEEELRSFVPHLDVKCSVRVVRTNSRGHSAVADVSTRSNAITCCVQRRGGAMLECERLLFVFSTLYACLLAVSAVLTCVCDSAPTGARRISAGEPRANGCRCAVAVSPQHPQGRHVGCAIE